MSTTQALVDRHDAARVVGRSPQQPRLDGRRRGPQSGCMQQRMMYVELKTGYDIDRGPAWISRVDFSRSGRTVYFHGRVLRRARSFDANHIDAASGDRYWVSGPRRDRSDRRYTNLPVHVDDEVAHEYHAYLEGGDPSLARPVERTDASASPVSQDQARGR